MCKNAGVDTYLQSYGPKFAFLWVTDCQKKGKHAHRKFCPFDFNHKNTHQKSIRLLKKDIVCANKIEGVKAAFPALAFKVGYAGQTAISLRLRQGQLWRTHDQSFLKSISIRVQWDVATRSINRPSTLQFLKYPTDCSLAPQQR
jgi:hypothetical protein